MTESPVLPPGTINQFTALLDTCVLAPMPVVDTLLRLAEEPAFYTPKWSPDILGELRRVLLCNFRLTEQQVQRRLNALEITFPSAMVTGYEDLIGSMTNDVKDRHVLAAAVRSNAHAIISDNVRDFPESSLRSYGIECLTADKFLQHQYHLNPDAFINILCEQARDIGWSLPQLLSKHVPSLSRLIVVPREE